ncbi:hypothetical protein DFP72DRAFT_1084111 [Ephemerocybe angulata]|uniref:Uncharacterized protein n=1 Tax=Ephemerocybe angulata TaxID=980116 RepID=A0A8H6LT80_9AGAR|nr:hypothetical protein DFP72DRAFT_1084104 [Tulosesus angulatus]KAF6741399.1 hypothetical protein DFP72DRAFT_1084111 [Tulosesus angulatus]
MSADAYPESTHQRLPYTSTLEYLDDQSADQIAGLSATMHVEATKARARAEKRWRKAEEAAEIAHHRTPLARMAHLLAKMDVCWGVNDEANHKLLKELDDAEEERDEARRKWWTSRQIVLDVNGHLLCLGEKRMQESFYRHIRRVETSFGFSHPYDEDFEPGPSLDSDGDAGGDTGPEDEGRSSSEGYPSDSEAVSSDDDFNDDSGNEGGNEEARESDVVDEVVGDADRRS